MTVQSRLLRHIERRVQLCAVEDMFGDSLLFEGLEPGPTTRAAGELGESDELVAAAEEVVWEEVDLGGGQKDDAGGLVEDLQHGCDVVFAIGILTNERVCVLEEEEEVHALAEMERCLEAFLEAAGGAAQLVDGGLPDAGFVHVCN